MMAKASIDVSNRPITKSRSAAAQTTQKKKLATMIEQPSVVLKKTTLELSTAKMYAILEAVCDRVETHENIGRQRDNWNALLLGSVNAMTLSAAVISAISSATEPHHRHFSTLLTLNLSSFVLFSAAAGISAVMAKIQPSQLAEEQRNASRLFRRLRSRLETVLAVRSPTEADVSEAAEEVLALDRAFPLPLLGGAMLEKFPERFKPAVWWPRKEKNTNCSDGGECLEIARVLRSKDGAEYERLGGLVLRVNKALAVLGPAVGAAAAASAPFVGIGEWAAAAAVVGGAVACAVNSVQHGGQIGMVVEMYRNCAGVLRLMEETIESNDVSEEREDGELFLMEVALGLGRSLPQMAEIAAKSVDAREKGTAIDEFVSKLF